MSYSLPSPATPTFSIPSPASPIPSPESPGYSPCSPRDEARYQERQRLWEERKQYIPRLPNPRPRALTPNSGSGSDSQAPKALYQVSCSWFKVPPNIRRDILRLAFGDSRLHMYLDHSHPDAARHQSPDNHCGIVNQQLETYYDTKERFVDESRPADWQWCGSVCHRLPRYPSQPMTSDGLPGPWADSCRHGDADYCWELRAKGNPSWCCIGVMGWLLSCRQNYVETIDILYSTNTLVMDGEEMIMNLPQLLLPRRLAQMTSLEITWPLKPCFYPDDPDYQTIDKNRFNNMLDLLSSSQFLALRRLYIYIEEGGNSEVFRNPKGYLDAILEKHVSHLHECAFAVERNHFKNIFRRATTALKPHSKYNEGLSYRQVWRSISGEMAVVQLPYVDSYPGPPYHLAQDGAQPIGYWILDGTDRPARESPPQRWCTLSPIYYTDGGSPDIPW